MSIVNCSGSQHRHFQHDFIAVEKTHQTVNYGADGRANNILTHTKQILVCSHCTEIFDPWKESGDAKPRP